MKWLNLLKEFLKDFSAILIVIFSIGFYFWHFNRYFAESHGWLAVINNLSDQPANWGVFGDYLNPSISFVALVYLVRTFKLQKNELEETRKTLELSQTTQDKELRLLASAELHKVNQVKINYLSEHLIHLYDKSDEYKKSDDYRNRKLYPSMSSVDVENPYSEQISSISNKMQRLENENNIIEEKIRILLIE